MRRNAAPKRRKLFRHKHCRRFNADFEFSLLAAPLVLDLLHSGKEFLTQLIDSEAKIRSDGRPIFLQGLSTAAEILPKVTKKRREKARVSIFTHGTYCLSCRLWDKHVGLHHDYCRRPANGRAARRLLSPLGPADFRVPSAPARIRWGGRGEGRESR